MPPRRTTNNAVLRPVRATARSRAVLLAMAALLGAVAPARADVAVYGDALAAGWQDWSWGGVTRDYARTTPVHGGTQALGITFTGGWSGVQLGRNDAVDLAGADVLRCWVHGGSAGGQQVEIEVGNHLTGAKTRLAITPLANTWTRVDVPLAALGTTQVTYLFWFNATAGAQPTFTVDDVAFVATGAPTPTPPGPVAGPALHVDAAAGRRAISPYIYGMNFADEALATELRLTVRRWGGNATTRYNWRTDTANRAADWYFENVPNENPNPAALPDGSSSDRFVEENRRAGAETLLTIPMIGWTPRGRAYGCGFSVAKYGAQQSTDPWRPDCGNGVRTNGSEITGNDPTDISDPIGPAFVQEWMQHLIGRYGSASSGGVRFYNLDNEPMTVGRHAPRRASRSARLRRAARSHRRLRGGDQGRRSRRRDARSRRMGLVGLLLVGARRRAGRRLVDEPPRPPRARQPAAHRLVPAAAAPVRAAARPAAARLP